MNSTFNSDKFLGYLSKVSPYSCSIHFPNTRLLKKYWYYEEELSGGVVGSYVVIEDDKCGFLAKIHEISLPKEDRLYLNSKNIENSNLHPEGVIEILFSFDFYLIDGQIKVERGIDKFPTIGSKVYLCSNELFKKFFQNSDAKSFDFAYLPDKKNDFNIDPNVLFSRHCAVLGTTGSGKSYTISKILEQFNTLGSTKAILIDATGEYEDFYDKDYIECVKFGDLDESTFFHYCRLRDTDFLGLFNPSEGTQKPKLLDAIKSLKLVQLYELEKKDILDLRANNIIKEDSLVKEAFETHYFNSLYNMYKTQIEQPNLYFDIQKIKSQLACESVKEKKSKYEYDGSIYNNVYPLINRITKMIEDRHYKKIFGFDKKLDDSNEFNSKLDNFLSETNKKRVFIISLRDVYFENNLREILVNAIGNYFLSKARELKFKEKPIVLFVDEAHQFLSKIVKSDSNEVELDSFDKIAKECRKHGLFLCISTQMPRDIPIGTLSQIGTFIVHRLINEHDIDVIEKASADTNKKSLSYLPVLKSGEAIIVSINLPISMIIKIKEPNTKPNSQTPKIS